MERKDFIKTTLLGIASMPFLSFSKALNEYVLYDVVIIGAGLSGLNAARLLAKAGKNILVLEAQERVGGRTWSQQIDQNSFMDLGGQWIGDGHEQMYKLVSEAGLRTFPSFNEGKNILRLDGTNDEYKGDTPPLGIFALLATQKALNRIDNATSKISLEKPWLSDNANELDNQSVGSFIDETITNSKARKLIKRLLE